MRKNKEGAASFYIVAFSTLVLLILAVSFATVIISEIERTSNNDLSQSAYDSAMAGIEDAKLAFYNYQTCKNSGDTSTACQKVVSIMEGQADCYMVGRMLGRISTGEEGEVKIEDNSGSSNSNNMQQAYTCVKIQTLLEDYRSTLSASNPIRVVKVQLGNETSASEIEKVKISWYAPEDQKTNYSHFSSKRVVFPKIGGLTSTAMPPTISVALVQTAENFSLDDFKTAVGDRTDRGMLYLVPLNSTQFASASTTNQYGAYKKANNGVISASAFVESNSQENRNLPYAVQCGTGGEFMCSVTIELPKPVNGERNDDTFMFAIALPYGRPTTDFAMEFLCADENHCGENRVEVSDGGYEKTDKASLSGVQVKIDSTGRANDLYRRVEVRLESAADSSFVSLMGPLELLGDESGYGTGSGLIKNYSAIREYNSVFNLK